jgi:2-oxoglutarate ferredoxin oxidoreductase subunit delta
MAEEVKKLEAQATSRFEKGPRGQVVIFPNRCKGCRICVEFCPTGVLDFIPTQEHPAVVHPENCTACHWCDTHCPDLAIVVKKLD